MGRRIAGETFCTDNARVDAAINADLEDVRHFRNV
jgi:hypothetical protein